MRIAPAQNPLRHLLKDFQAFFTSPAWGGPDNRERPRLRAQVAWTSKTNIEIIPIAESCWRQSGNGRSSAAVRLYPVGGWYWAAELRSCQIWAGQRMPTAYETR